LIGAAAFALSLPAWHAVMASLPGTLLRAPVRQLYVTTFALAVALGAAIDCLIRITPRSSLRTAYVVIGVALIAHGWDLGMHDRAFILPSRRSETLDPATASAIATSLHDGRIAMDYLLVSQWNRRFDDVGFFDSIMLARPYKGLLDLTGNFPWLNVQHMDGSSLTGRALAALGVRFLVTVRERSDLRDVPSRSGVHVYRVPDAADRVAFFPDASAEILSPARIHEQLRDPAFDASRTLLLRGDEATDPQELPAPPSGPAVVSYRRPSPDDVEIDVDAPVPGWVRLIESWDPGWHAEVDGATVPVLAGDDMFIAIRVAAGRHRIRLRFQTPGASTGVALSIVRLVGLAGLAWLAAKGRPIWSRQG